MFLICPRRPKTRMLPLQNDETDPFGQNMNVADIARLPAAIARRALPVAQASSPAGCGGVSPPRPLPCARTTALQPGAEDRFERGSPKSRSAAFTPHQSKKPCQRANVSLAGRLALPCFDLEFGPVRPFGVRLPIIGSPVSSFYMLHSAFSLRGHLPA